MLPTRKASEWGTCRALLEKMQPAVHDRPVLLFFSAQSMQVVPKCLGNHSGQGKDTFKRTRCQVRRDRSRKESFSQLIGESEAVYSRTADQHSSQTDGLTGICLFDHLGFNRSTSSDLMYIEQEIERGKAAEAGQLIRENGREGIGTLLGAAGRAG